MRISLLLAAVFLSGGAQAQVTETVSINPGYADQLWYSLQNGTVNSRPALEWDLAFELPGFTASILVNTIKPGFSVHRAPYSVSDWNVLDTAGLATWPTLQNSDTSWSVGGFNTSTTGGEFDLGWGDYNFVTHAVVGDSLYVVKLATGAWRKLRIDGLVAGTYMLTHSALDGTDEQSVSVQKSLFPGRHFAYLDLSTGTTLNREPAGADWDLVFTKYITFVPQPYGVAGVLHNRNAQALRVSGMPHSLASYDLSPMATAINTIGYDWKTFNMSTSAWELDEEMTFFVKDVPGNIWKVYFTGFGGATNGEFTFVKELVSATSVADAMSHPTAVQVFPNPVSNGRATLVADLNEPVQHIRVVDASGREVRRFGPRAAVGLVQLELDLAGLPSGMYMIRLETAHASAHTRVLVD
ncbi:MAG: T9SS type A sorting domain-containing protein [Flavobacteriales bacterium]|nr:T9SS type A sorting domain-containing protein [Flavobacteriales bacterium]